MTWISDQAISRLREAAEFPDLSHTPYRVLTRLASGGMGTVYLAEDTRLGREVAVKVTNIIDDTGALASRMLDEAKVIARLEHPGIVPVHDLGTLSDGRVFYVMKFVRGNSLDQYLKEAPLLSDRLRIFQRVCESVAFAHSNGFIHRDLKPENIMVGRFGEVLVMDWGVAKTSGGGCDLTNESASESNNRSSVGTDHGTVVGTLAYMAPEQARGEICDLDQRADVYSLGCVLYFLLTERPPFRPANHSDRIIPVSPRHLSSSITRPLEAICLKAMSDDRGQRYTSALELSNDVTRYLDGDSVSAYRENLLERATRWTGKNRFIVLLVLAYLVMRILVLLIFRR